MTPSPELQAKQAAVRRRIVAGVAAALLMLLGLYVCLPPPRHVDTAVDRLTLALRCNVVAALTLFAGIHTVARLRRHTEAIDPLAGKEPPNLRVHNRYVQNTVEQLTLFALGTAALSTFLDSNTVRALPALTVAFTVARILFWRGYLQDPLARATGMAATFVINLLVFAAVAYFTVRDGLGI